jgi:uncharacterized protein YceK
MKSPSIRFNIILLLLAVTFLLSACNTSKTSKSADGKKSKEQLAAKKYKKERVMIQLFLESPKGTQGHSVPILRGEPVYVNVQGSPFIEWKHIKSAELVDVQGGFAMQLFLDAHGTFVLDTITTANRNRRIVVLAQIAGEEQRWLAAPKIMQRNASGVLAFTPDATREEAEQIVWGIRNLISEATRQGTM